MREVSCLDEKSLFPKLIDNIVWDEFRISFLTLDLSRVVFLPIYPSWVSSTIPEDLLFFIICSYQAWRLIERCWPPRLPLTLDCSCVALTFIFIPLWVLYNLRILSLTKLYFLFGWEKLYFRNLLIISSVTIFFSLILDLSRVVSLLFTLRGSHLLSQQIFLTNSNSWWIVLLSSVLGPETALGFLMHLRSLKWQRRRGARKNRRYMALVRRTGREEATCYVTHPDSRSVIIRA